MKSNEMNLEDFYENWSLKSAKEIDSDIESSVRKARKILEIVPEDIKEKLDSVLDFGCGYGGLLVEFKNSTNVTSARGLDFSQKAIEEANKRFSGENVQFFKLNALGLGHIEKDLNEIIPGGVDCIVLADVLEHVPDCRGLVKLLSSYAKYFLIKLPIESTILDNYILPKEYPSGSHSNGHVREFNCNDVHYFISSLGLTPIRQSLYSYELIDSLPEIPPNLSTLKRKAFRAFLWSLKGAFRQILPTKIFLRVIGGGGYICVATHSASHMTSP